MAQAYYQLGISYFGQPNTIPDAIPTLEKFQQLVAALPKEQQAPFANDVEAATQLIAAAKQAAPTAYKSEKAIAEEKAAQEKAEKQKAAGEKAPFLNFVPFVFTSAITGQRISRILELMLQVEQERLKRVSTSEVNERLQELIARRQPPQAAGREVKLNYATQVEVAPPTIAVFGNHPDLVQEHYVRYLHNGFH